MTTTIRTMSFQKMDAYVLAKALAKCVHEASIGEAELRDQARRASKSCFLQLAEGLASPSAANKKRYRAMANGSLFETAAALDLAEALGAEVSEARAHAARVYALLGGLMRR